MRLVETVGKGIEFIGLVGVMASVYVEVVAAIHLANQDVNRFEML